MHDDTYCMLGKYLDQFPDNNYLKDYINTKTEATERSERSMVQYGVFLTAAITTRGCTDIINKDWVLPYSWSMVVCVWNEGLLKKFIIVR